MLISIVGSIVLLASLGNGQPMLFIGEIEQPGPNFGDLQPEVALFNSPKTLDKGLYVDEHIYEDTLIDPDGRIAEFSRKNSQRKAADLNEEKELLEEIAKRDGTNVVTVRIFCWTLLGCACIVACGVLPAFILPNNSDQFLQSNTGRQSLNLLLSFAVGSLVGDVFLHLLPTVWADDQIDQTSAGIWTTAGVLFCFLLEKCCATSESCQKKICAILNLVANFMDNFTHGLAVGGSFLIEPKLGLLTTFAIVIHELPHEISDFAILLRANFSKWAAVRAQLMTAVGGVLGSCAALFLHSNFSSGGVAQRILPFTAGGFLNIALAQILPELMKESNIRQNLLQICTFLAGVMVMATLCQLRID